MDFYQIKVQASQSLTDIAMQEYGDAEGIFLLVYDNVILDDDITATLSAGLILQIRTGEDPAYPIPAYPGLAFVRRDKVYTLFETTIIGTGQVRVKNTDSSLNTLVNAGETYTVANSHIENSDNSFSHDVPATETYTLPDTTQTDSDGSTVAWPSGKDFVCKFSSPLRRWITSVGISYRTYDDKYFAAEETTTIELADFYTLGGVNQFGNFDRFTDINGLQVYADPYVIDHATGLGWCLTVQGFKVWNDAIDLAGTFSLIVNPTAGAVTYSDFKLPNIVHYMSLVLWHLLGQFLNYAPFNIMNKEFWTSSTDEGNTGDAFTLGEGSITIINEVSKGSFKQHLMYRKHF